MAVCAPLERRDRVVSPRSVSGVPCISALAQRTQDLTRTMQASSRTMLRSLRTRTLQPQYLASQTLRAGLSTSAARSDDDKGKKSGGILKVG